MSKTSTSAPFNNLEEIARKKKAIRLAIQQQESILVEDFDAYQEDVDTFKNIWKGILGIRRFRQNGIVSSITKLTSKGSYASIVISVVTKIAKFFWQRRNRS